MGIGRQIKKRAVFLDRDGVINRAIVREGKPSTTLAELEILPGVPTALARLHQAGFWLIVVTNQVARGTQTQSTVEEFHQPKIIAYRRISGLLP